MDSVSGEPIRDEADYHGVRIKLTARLATAHIALHVDVNFGDPIWPAPTEAVLPLLLGGTLRLLGYPDHMVLAEKIITALDRGDLNTRWRDFTDIAAITRTRSIEGSDLSEAIEIVANYRQVTIERLEPLISQMPTVAQRKWEVWRRKQRLEATTPKSFGELLKTCLAFSEPLLNGDVRSSIWDPGAGSWVPSTEPNSH